MKDRKNTHPLIHALKANKLDTLVTLFLIAVLIYACGKQDQNNPENNAITETTTTGKSNSGQVPAVAAAQPLPAGRRFYTTVSGNLNTTGDTWVQLINYTFDAAGTVNATRYWWGSTSKKAPTQVNGAHNCTQDGILKACNTYTLNGWMGVGTPMSQNMAGTYTMDPGGTGTLTITWSSGPLSGRVENWTVSDAPFGYPLGKLLFSSVGAGWGSNPVTHGIGYGSTTAFTGTAGFNYKTVSQVPNVAYPSSHGQRIMAYTPNSSTNPTSSGWVAEGFNFGTANGWTTATGGVTWHAKQGTTICTAGCSSGNNHVGHIYHLAGIGTGTSRQMGYAHFCACLPTTSEFPCYSRNMHPYAFMQVIDDNGDMQGFLGVEAQNHPDSQYNGQYQFQLKSYLR